jgi:hypothetical protein
VEGTLGFFMFVIPRANQTHGGTAKVTRLARKRKRNARPFPTFCGTGIRKIKAASA